MPAIAVIGARSWLRVVVVEGSSMAPTYRDGDRVLAVYGWQRLWLKVGQVVVVRAPAPGWTPDQPIEAAGVSLIKRVASIGTDRGARDGDAVPCEVVYVAGDATGYDSRTFGPLPRSEVLGAVLLRLSRRGTHGPGPS